MRHYSVAFRFSATIVLLFGTIVGAAQAANTVPWLTGTFTGGASLFYSYCDFNSGDTGSASPTGAYIDYPGTGSWGSWTINSVQTSVTGTYDGNSCSYSYSGVTDGPIAGTYGSLTFAGVVTGGTFDSSQRVFDGGDASETGGSFTAPFTGFWSNGMHSTGTLYGSWYIINGFNYPIATLEITTVAPEPSTFLMLGVLPIIGAIRWRRMKL